MKKSILSCIMLLFLSILTFSQTTYPKVTRDSLIVITPEQLIQTNLIFLEHNKLKAEIAEMNKQLYSYQNMIELYNTAEDYYKEEFSKLMNSYEDSQSIIKTKNVELIKCDKKLKKWKTIGVCGVSISCVLLLTAVLIQ